jgi:hypothetical protein
LELVDDLLYWNSSSSAKGIALKKERKKERKGGNKNPAQPSSPFL